MIKYIGFDKDGTLIDDIPIYIKLWGEIVNRDFGINSSYAANIFSQMIGKSAESQLKITLEEKNIHLSPEDIFQKSNKIAQELGDRAKGDLFPEVLNVLKNLKQKGYNVFISSGQQEKVIDDDLKRTKIIEYIDLALGIRNDKPEFKKGEPHFRTAAKFFGVPFKTFVQETIFIGDTPTDIEVANYSKIINIGRIDTFSKEKLLNAGANYTIRDLTELLNILKKLNS